MKNILATVLFTVLIFSAKAQDISHEKIFFNNLYSLASNGSPAEQEHYHISNRLFNNGYWGLDIKWFGGIKLTGTSGDIALRSGQYNQIKFITGDNENNYLAYQNADLVLRYTPRGSGGRALVQEIDNILTLNYTGDFNGGTKIGNGVMIKNNGDSAFQGKIEAKEIKVTQGPTADFVFEENYGLPKLEDVEKHIKEKKHLPEIASAKEMEKEGVNVGEFQIKLLQKIEELTLYSIEQSKQIKKLQEENKFLKNQSEEIEFVKDELKNLKTLVLKK